jgi:hypothetical protein
MNGMCPAFTISILAASISSNVTGKPDFAKTIPRGRPT